MSSGTGIISLKQITATHLPPPSRNPPERNGTRTARIEGFWKLFKDDYRGTYVHVSPKYLDLYFGEFEYRWNLRRSPALMLPVLLQALAKPEHRAPSLSKAGQSVA